jgi:hypothetical protein
MKPNHYRALREFEPIHLFAPILLAVVFAAGIPIFAYAHYTDSGVLIGMIASFGGLAIVSSNRCLMPGGGFSSSPRDLVVGVPLEFLFSRAIDRRVLYWIRVRWFFASAATPFLALAAVSLCWSRIQFEIAVVALWVELVVAAVYQALVLGTPPSRRWPQLLGWLVGVPFAYLLVAAHQVDERRLRPSGVYRPPAPEQWLVRAIHHPLPVLGIGALLVGFALTLGCRRFSRQEVLP